MLWREAYSTAVYEGFEPIEEVRVQSLDGGSALASDESLVIGGTGFASWSAQELWARLTRDEFGDSVDPLHVFLEPEDAGSVGLIVPASRHRRVGWSATDWTGLRPAVFAWCPMASLLMVGLATEDAWETMAAALRGQRSSG